MLFRSVSQSRYGQHPDAQVGIVTGAISNLTVIDVEEDGDLEMIKEPTLVVKTGGGGRHFYFQYESEFKNAVRIFPSVNVRSEGGYVIAYGSKSQKGTYEALNTLPVGKMSETTKKTFLEANRRQLPWFANSGTPTIKSEAEKTLEYNGSLEGGRNDSMTKLAGSIHAKLHSSLWSNIGWKMFEEANLKNSPPLSTYERLS